MTRKLSFTAMLGVFGVMVVLAAALGLTMSRANALDDRVRNSDKRAADSGSDYGLQNTRPVTTYLPLVTMNYPPPPPVFGVEINRGAVGATLSQTIEAGVWWVRYNGILWSEVEPEIGLRDWSKLSDVEQEIRALSAHGLIPMVIVRGTPSWAQRVQGSYCGPIKEDALDEFAAFMREVVSRYSVEPYNVKYWELGNEPDVDPGLVPPTSPFGCWGDKGDDYYGGGYYAEMLKRVYPAIKQADPTAQVVVGGLLLDCDPQSGTGGCDRQPGRFLEGILRNGGGPFFDILAYHAYPLWTPDERGDWDLNHPHWRHRGGALLGKLDFIKSVFQNYGISKPILMNEGGLMCDSRDDNDPACSRDDFRDDQAKYVVRLYARTWAHNILGSVWYTMNGPGWRQGGLLDGSQHPRPSYDAFKFMSTLLEGSSYRGPLATGALEGYAFFNKSARREYQVYWTNDKAYTTTLTLPKGAVAYNKFGQTLTPMDGKISVGFDPVFIVVAVP
ncbi:hypothetical protein [Thermoflexus sp.]|uniref:hypothetical protein n=1 Tax=Thermoflexus sp. TaxID=1969742 RepID=UPI0035E40C9E